MSSVYDDVIVARRALIAETRFDGDDDSTKSNAEIVIKIGRNYRNRYRIHPSAFVSAGNWITMRRLSDDSKQSACVTDIYDTNGQSLSNAITLKKTQVKQNKKSRNIILGSITLQGWIAIHIDVSLRSKNNRSIADPYANIEVKVKLRLYSQISGNTNRSFIFKEEAPHLVASGKKLNHKIANEDWVIQSVRDILNKII